MTKRLSVPMHSANQTKTKSTKNAMPPHITHWRSVNLKHLQTFHNQNVLKREGPQQSFRQKHWTCVASPASNFAAMSLYRRYVDILSLQLRRLATPNRKINAKTHQNSRFSLHSLHVHHKTQHTDVCYSFSIFFDSELVQPHLHQIQSKHLFSESLQHWTRQPRNCSVVSDSIFCVYLYCL